MKSVFVLQPLPRTKHRLGPTEKVLREEGSRFVSETSFSVEFGRWVISKTYVILIIQHGHRPSELMKMAEQVIYLCFRGVYCFHHRGHGCGNEIQSIMELRRTSFQLTSVTFQRVATFFADRWHFSSFHYTHYKQLRTPHASESIHHGATDNGSYNEYAGLYRSADNCVSFALS